MRYSEFEQLVKDEGFNTKRERASLHVFDNQKRAIASIGRSEMFMLDTNRYYFLLLSDYDKKRLFNLATELASTPLEDREDEKKYYVKFMEKVYLVHYPKSGNYGVVSTREGAQGKTQFTEQEIKNYDSRYWAFAEEVKEDE